MTQYVLRSPREADDTLADLLMCHSAQAREISLQLKVREDVCFREDTWVSVGNVTLHREGVEASPERDAGAFSMQRALRYGFFDWSLPDQCTLEKEIMAAVKFPDGHQANDRDRKHVVTATKAVAQVVLRCGLAHPMIDAMALSSMPFHKTVSVVADTTAILQGGIAFVALHLVPAARITIPAIVHMEILNLSDRYLSQRRANKHGAQMLADHVLSQGGQRVLLSLERQHQIERSRLGADPLRGIIQPDSDAEDKSLGLQRVQRSFADRLILETAIQRRDRVEPNHPVMLMTADQGLARMALAEGIEPIFFDADGVSSLYGTTVSGVTFRPFKRGADTYTVALTSVLWELSIAFGCVRVVHVDSGDTFEVAAIGESLSWQPYHSSDDLLWTCATARDSAVDQRRTTTAVAGIVPSEPATKTSTSPESRTTTKAGSTVQIPVKRGDLTDDTDQPLAAEAATRYAGSYSFSPNSMLNLMVALSYGGLSDEEGMEVAGVRSIEAYVQYFRFLLAGGFVSRRGSGLRGTGSLAELLRAMLHAAFKDMQNLLKRVKSFGQFLNRLSVGVPLTARESAIRSNAFTPYCTLAELCCAGVRFAEAGIYATPKNPPPDEFAVHALSAYDAVRRGDDFALTGAWLEYLVRDVGIHPVRVRQRLAEAFQGGYVRRFFEGSTPDTRYESRTFHVLNKDESGVPSIRRMNLYHGDFLMPGRATGSIKLSEGKT